MRWPNCYIDLVFVHWSEERDPPTFPKKMMVKKTEGGRGGLFRLCALMPEDLFAAAAMMKIWLSITLALLVTAGAVHDWSRIRGSGLSAF